MNAACKDHIRLMTYETQDLYHFMSFDFVGDAWEFSSRRTDYLQGLPQGGCRDELCGLCVFAGCDSSLVGRFSLFLV